MRAITLFGLAAIVSSAHGSAQAQTQKPTVDTLRTLRVDTTGRGNGAEVTKTIALRHLSNGDAVKLLTPYLAGRGWVYQMGSGMHAVTIRASGQGIADAEKVLAEYDRSPVTLTLNFQLIAAENTNTRDPAVAGLDSVLRGVLKFTGYRLLATAMANVTEGSSATQTMSDDAGNDYLLSCDVEAVAGAGAESSVHLVVELRRRGGPAGIDPQLFSTGVTIPFGNTVVLGSTVEAKTTTGVNALKTATGENHVQPTTAERGLILTVHPTIDATKSRD